MMNAESAAKPITYRGVVYRWHCDHMGHMNVMWYVGKFDEATWNLFASIGITAAYVREQKHGMAGLQQNITYKKELVAGDVVVVRSEILEVREKVIRFQHELLNGEEGELAAVCELTAAHLDLRDTQVPAIPARDSGARSCRSPRLIR
jgi:acyl-CoA thioester hydrolase